MTTAFFAHDRDDHEVASGLAGFLECGCDVTCCVDDGQIGENQDLIAKAEEGLSADVLLLLLSRSSSPTRWVRQRWEPVLFEQARQANVDVVTVLLQSCSFPPLLQRRNFIDATTNWLNARRLLKRWFRVREREPGAAPNAGFSGDLEDLYAGMADSAGTMHVSGAQASRFAKEAAEEFETVLWVPCQGRSLAQAAGELGRQLGLALDGPKEENCERIRDSLGVRRCLVVLDGPGAEVFPELIASGRTSTTITRDTVKVLETPETLAYARNLVTARRFAEAYELLYRLLNAGIDPDGCARELSWICEHWGRVEEASGLRSNCRPSRAVQLSLFENTARRGSSR